MGLQANLTVSQPQQSMQIAVLSSLCYLAPTVLNSILPGICEALSDRSDQVKEKARQIVSKGASQAADGLRRLAAVAVKVQGRDVANRLEILAGDSEGIAAEDLNVCEITQQTSGIVQDLKTLEPYYKAISLINLGLERAIDVVSPKFFQNGFTHWPTPNPYYSRTPNFMFLETSLKPTMEVVSTLYTPMGEVKILGGGSYDELDSVSCELFKSMDWKLVNVTNSLKVYRYDQGKNKKYGPYEPKQETWEGSGLAAKFYLVKKVGEIEFTPVPGEELAYFSDVSLSEGQYEKDKEQFRNLSGGSMNFFNHHQPVHGGKVSVDDAASVEEGSGL